MGVRVETVLRQETIRGTGKGQKAVLCPHSLQRLKIPKRRTSGERGNEIEGWPTGLVGVGRQVTVDERGAQSSASPTPPGFFR